MPEGYLLIGGNMPEEVCTEYIYSEDYGSYLIKYDNDLEWVNNIVAPNCVNIINNQFLVAYKKIDLNENIYRYGYNSVPKCYGLMDVTAVEALGADTVRRLPGLGLTGRDVIIGFVDTGIDYTNPLFRNPDGSSRIEFIWDQNENQMGKGPSVFGYGAEYTRADINSALVTDSPFEVVPTRDENGHGTFLASVAAGGVNQEADFTGVAPDSKIVVVKLKQAKNNLRDYMRINDGAICYAEDDIILGVKYLINKAIGLDRPLVICVGLGSSQGDHNGNTNLELYFDTLANLRGVCVITPTGNELGFAGHFSGNNRINATSGMEDVEISVGDNDKGFVLELWGNAPGLLQVSVLSPTGERLGGISPIKDGMSELSFLYEGTKVYVNNFVVDSNTGDQLVIFRFLEPTRGIWTINVNETSGVIGGGFDAWLPIHDFLNSDVRFVRPDPNVTICAPGNGRGSITLAGYNHTNNALYINSGRGFTRKGRIKPDVTAPAVEVYGAFSAGGTAGMELFTRKSGTSIAASLTAGVVALIMEWGLVKGNNPGITTEVIRQMLIRGSRKVADVEYPNKSWGWGVVNVYEAFNVIRNM